MPRRQPIDLAAILGILDDPRSVPDLQRYFGVGQCPLTGGRFERLGGGGDRPETRDEITAEDLIAVEMLNVQVPPRVSLALLEGDLSQDIRAELSRIPTNVCLGDDGAAERVADHSPADEAWHLLKGCDDVGKAIAGKVLARKRPKLIPVYDEVVRCVYRTTRGFWLWLDDKLREDGGVLPRRLEELRAEASLSAEISPLRILDVVIWMRHHNEHTKTRCPGLNG